MQLSRNKYVEAPPNEAAIIEAALTGPHPPCPDCGIEHVPELVKLPTLALAWAICPRPHLASCGLPCVPRGISYVGEPQWHMKGCCPRCDA